jgi:polysaccharide export outer membrane protein
VALGLIILSTPPAAGRAPDDVVRPRDVLSVAVWNQPALSGLFLVEDDGAFTFPLVGRIQASGLTVRALEANLAAQLADGFLTAPQVRIDIHQRAGRVLLMGEVRRPGAYPLTPGLTLAEALALAGWITARAGTDAAVLRDVDGRTRAVDLDSSAQSVAVVDVSRAESLASGARFLLSDGDVVLVRAAPTVHVEGPVARPGEYAIDPDAQVIHVLSRAGGLRENASDGDIRIVRVIGGTRLELDAEPATRLQPGDVVVVGNRRPFRLRPRFGAHRVGYDSNIHHDAVERRADFVATLRGGLDAIGRTPRVSVEGHGTLDFRYFHKYEELRAFDASGSGRFDLRLNRLLPYVQAAFDNSLARDRWETPRQLRRTSVYAEAGTALRLTRLTTLIPSVRRRWVDYEPPSSSVASGVYPLDRDEDRAALVARTAFTARTTGEITVAAERARFHSAIERDSTTLEIVPGVTLGRLGAVAARAAAGYKQVTFDKPPLRDFRGVVGNLDLSRAISDRTGVTLSAARDFGYSAERANGYYIYSAIAPGVTHWMNRAWRFDASAGPVWLRYDAWPGEAGRTDDGFTLDARVGRRFDGTTFEIGVDYQLRRSERGRYAFDALLVGASVTYAR